MEETEHNFESYLEILDALAMSDEGLIFCLSRADRKKFSGGLSAARTRKCPGLSIRSEVIGTDENGLLKVKYTLLDEKKQRSSDFISSLKVIKNKE